MRSLTTAIVGAMLLSLLAADAMAQERPDRGPRPPRGGEREGGYGRGGREGGFGRGREGGFRMPPSVLMRALDADKNGELSADEIKKAAAALKKLDKDEDGKLSREELRPTFTRGSRSGEGGGRPGGGPPMGEEFIKRMMSLDKDGDGKITKEELPERAQRMLEFADKNKDGALDKDEIKAMAERRGPGRSGGERPGGGRPSGADFIKQIMTHDKDGDGKVTKEELPERMQRMLQYVDKNKDGALDEEELKAMAERRRQGRGGRGGRPGGGGEGGRGGSGGGSE